MALGPLPAEVDIVLGWCALHGLLKDPFGLSVRPLAVGEYFRRAIYSALLYSARDKCRAVLFDGEGARGAGRFPRQFAVGLACGSDMLAHAVRLLLEVCPGLCVLKLDSRNAFNEICRFRMLSELRRHVPELFRWAYRMYGNPAEPGPRLLFGLRDGQVRVIWSRQGPQQGDPGGPALFALALHPALHALQARLGQEVYILAFSDDILILVPYGQVKRALLTAKDTLQEECGLTLQPGKCVVFDPTPGREPEPEFRRGGRWRTSSGGREEEGRHPGSWWWEARWVRRRTGRTPCRRRRKDRCNGRGDTSVSSRGSAPRRKGCTSCEEVGCTCFLSSHGWRRPRRHGGRRGHLTSLQQRHSAP